LAAAAQPSRPAPHPATALGEPYLVQVGVFSEPERARELVERLQKRGIRAHMETRVHLGPFANREEAEKAQAAVRGLGLKAVLTPVAATK
jgi:DedD protein